MLLNGSTSGLTGINGDLNQIEGVLHIKNAIGLFANDRFTRESIMEEIQPAYFVPIGTKLFS